MLTFSFEQGKLGAYSTYRMQILSLVYFSMHVMYCALHIGFLDDGDRFHDSTLLYVILLIDVLPFYDYMCYA
jgi:hypothetical protein